MSSYRLIPTFRLARRLAHHHHPYPRWFPTESFFPLRHWKNSMEQHIGMMEKMFDMKWPGEQRCAERQKWFEEMRARPSEGGVESESRAFGQVKYGQDAKKFEMLLDLGEYKPEEVEVSVKIVNENQLSVEAKLESGTPETGYQKRLFSQVVTLPKEADIEALRSTLSDEGMLKVEAPMMTVEEVQTPVREIPIVRSTATSQKSADPVDGSGKTGNVQETPTSEK